MQFVLTMPCIGFPFCHFMSLSNSEHFWRYQLQVSLKSKGCCLQLQLHYQMTECHLLQTAWARTCLCAIHLLFAGKCIIWLYFTTGSKMIQCNLYVITDVVSLQKSWCICFSAGYLGRPFFDAVFSSITFAIAAVYVMTDFFLMVAIARESHVILPSVDAISWLCIMTFGAVSSVQARFHPEN